MRTLAAEHLLEENAPTPAPVSRRRTLLPWGPAGFQMATAAYAGSLGLTTLFATEAAAVHSNQHLMALLGIPSYVWGAFLGVYALSAVTCLVVSENDRKAALACVSCALWSFLGVWGVFHSMSVGRLHPDTVFQILLAVGSWVSMVQRVNIPENMIRRV